MITTDDRPVAPSQSRRERLAGARPMGGGQRAHASAVASPNLEADQPAARSGAADRLFAEYRRTGRRRERNAIVELHLGLASHIAGRMSGGGRRRDPDIEQVAMLALVKAVDRFDTSFEVPFVAFASRTIEGEIKRYFRDATWALKVPRGAKELHLVVRNGNEELSKRLGRSPTVDELAANLQLDRADVLTGLAAGEGRSTTSFDRPTDDEDADPDRSKSLGQIDRSFDDVDDRRAVAVLLERLPERERTIVELRFYEDMSQTEIAERMGISQMHVSRLLRRACATMRADDQAGNQP